MKRACCLLVLAWLLGLPADARPELLDLWGRAAAPSGDPLPGVTLTLRMEGQEDRVLVTDENGRFRFEGLPPG
ncbi:MAG: carboxypeptidase-like regulatory domain-containing protein, partial [Thermoanaerobaculia bacterium]